MPSARSLSRNSFANPALENFGAWPTRWIAFRAHRVELERARIGEARQARGFHLVIGQDLHVLKPMRHALGYCARPFRAREILDPGDRGWHIVKLRNLRLAARL